MFRLTPHLHRLQAIFLSPLGEHLVKRAVQHFLLWERLPPPPFPHCSSENKIHAVAVLVKDMCSADLNCWMRLWLKTSGVSIDGNFEVDFTGFEAIIDMVGGIDIELTSAEADISTSVMIPLSLRV